MAVVSTAEQAQTAAPPGPRRRQTVADMLRSLLVVLAGVLALVLLAPTPGEPLRQPVDVAGTAEQAGDEATVIVPDLPEGWTPNAARFAPRGDVAVPTWHVGYVTPSGGYAGLEVAEDAPERWLRDVTAQGAEVGAVGVRGARWRELVSPDGGRRSLVRQEAGVTQVVTGTAPLDELVALAEAVGT